VSGRDAIEERGGYLRGVLSVRDTSKERGGQERCNVRETR
jgi:hypothetical protein